MDQLDDKLRAAMQALEAGATPAGYFDGLPRTIDARLEDTMQLEEHGTDSSTGIPPRSEDSGVHDIKALARSTRQRISRRQTSQHDIEDSLLSSSQSGMHAIALPDPAKMIGLPTPEEAKALSQSMSMRAVSEAAPGSPATAQEPMILAARAAKAEKSRGVPVWLWAGGGVGVAAAAVIAFMVIGKDDKHADKAAAAKDDVIASASGEYRGSSMDEAPAKAAAPMAEAKQDSVTVTGLTDAAGMATGSAAGSGSAAVVVAEIPNEDPSTDKGAATDRAKKEHHAGAGAGSGSGSGSASGSAKKDIQVKAPPPDGSGSGSAKGSSKGSAKGDGKGTGEGGAVLGAGDSDELGIGDAIKGGGGGEHEDKPTNTELSSKDLRAGLDAVLGKAKGCYDGAVGTVKVKLTVASTGKVTKASASGELAGTPAANCVVDAIKGAHFPAWTGAQMSTTYAVLLSD